MWVPPSSAAGSDTGSTDKPEASTDNVLGEMELDGAADSTALSTLSAADSSCFGGPLPG